MDKLISDAKYDIISKVESDQFCEKMGNIENDTVKSEELIRAIGELSKKFKEYHPLRNSDGYNMFYFVFYKIKHILCDLTNAAFQSHIIIWIISIIESGWTATNAEFIIEISSLLPPEYFTEMTAEQLRSHLKILDITDFELSEHDIKDNESYIYEMQKKFANRFFVENVKQEDFELIYHEFLIHLHFKFWSKNEKSIEIYSNLIRTIERRYSNIYRQNPDVFVKHFQEITGKLIQEDLPTVAGQKEITYFYARHYSLLRESQTIAENIMEHWVLAIIDILKLDRSWTNEILTTLSREIRIIDQSFAKAAFSKCDHLFSVVIEMLLSVTDKYPRSKDSLKNDKGSEKITEIYNDLLKGFALNVFQYTLKTREQFESFTPVLLKLIDINESATNDIFSGFFNDFKKQTQGFLKTKPELLNPFIDQCVDTAIKFGTTEDVTIEFPFGKELRRLEDPYDGIKNLGKSSRAFSSPLVQSILRKALVKALNNYSLCVSNFIYGFQEYYIFKDYSSEDMLMLIQSLNKTMANDLFHIFNPKAYSFGSLMTNIIDHICKSIPQYRSSIEEIAKTPGILLKFDLQWEYDGEMRDTPSCIIIMAIFSKLLMTKTDSAVSALFFPILIEVLEKTDESSNFYMAYLSFLMSSPLTMTSPEVLAPQVGGMFRIGQKIINTDNQSMLSTMLMSVKSICTKDPSTLFPYLDNLEDIFAELCEDNSILMSIVTIFTMVYEQFPGKIKESVLTKIAARIKTELSNACQVVAFLNTVSKSDSKMVEPYLQDLFDCLKLFKVSVVGHVNLILTNILEANLALGERIFEAVVENIETNLDDVMYATVLLNGLRSLGVLRHDLLVALKEKIERWQQTKPPLNDLCQHLLDVIADRSLATLGADLNQQKKVIAVVDNRLLINEDKVENIERDVEAHEMALSDVNQRVDDTNVKVDKIEANVKVIDEQVQEIDLKTVSSAPKWAREVSKLMNPESESDWRLLASRLGYSNDDIRAWATQADPCMSLLSEWFAVRRHIEATKSILEQLTEMNLTDVAKIVENALTAAESVISDDDPIEFTEPPLVFLSYQWAVQEEVKVLRSHLQKAGYRCWMDIGQMGGGDKLYEAIDRGIRGARVFISCVTEKYSQSANCKRELNLSIGLNKAVIPLQMERMDWPPAGTMGPLLTEYIFIRMFAKPAGKLVEGTFWPKERFQELLMQIRYSCAPDYDNVDEEYKDWWAPPEEKVTYTPKEGKKGDDKEVLISKVDIESPQIFLSYQWGKQEQVKKLFIMLTNLGFSCWMDIYQMGGGDSLYDKIDRGIRGCKLVISCVTPGYTQSPNCRREVSLCDNLKKPIIPILLEQMTWPPEGPMSMAFTQLLYISFVDSANEQISWKGPSTDELLKKIHQVTSPKNQPNSDRKPSLVSNADKGKVVADVKSKNEKTKKSVDLGIQPVNKVVLTNNALHLRSSSIQKSATTKMPQSKTCQLM